MRAIHHPQERDRERKETSAFVAGLVDRFSRLSELIWLGITFLLFIVMGPFSVIAVLYGLWALANGEWKEKMTEPASCSSYV